ncbi:abortive infection system antitoxin AbiGi family protein [Pseudoalteromonas sp. MTN2-4]|uniref:abortive infection system antitoxin AbiGi family protein n=1 Tax=Pseudoalteromonas sp. MTN2-4 TaxID=3056555 RepID=UPI0036F34080
MRSKSRNLFHFTPKLEFLESILENGFYPRFCLEDASTLDYYKQDFIAYPMVCFCDIPLSKINEHTLFYGSYGIGLKRSWGNKNRLAPVIYSSVDSPINDLARSLVKKMLIDNPDGLQEEVDAKNLLSLIKPIEGKMIIDNKEVLKEFYLENEWRFVPNNLSAIPKNSFSALRDQGNKELESTEPLKFTIDDIQYVFLKEEKEIPHMVDKLSTIFSSEPPSALKLLFTKIICLETLLSDI